MTTFWLPLTEQDLASLLLKQVPEAVRSAARDELIRHYQDAFASALYLKHSRKGSTRITTLEDSTSLQKGVLEHHRRSASNPLT